jgi:multidrug efflux pump subunit AcrA (membrane-fusion protein)
MRINRAALIGGAAATGLVIGVIGVIAFGQTRGRRVAVPAVPAGAPRGDKSVTVPGNLPAGERIEPNSLASSAVTSVRMTAEAGIVSVEAEAAIRETEPGYVSVWSLRIYEDTSPAADRRLV